MPIAFRTDLQGFLAEFINEHRGLRLGKMFGLPAGYVGRRLFTCVIEDGIIVRLPDDIARRELKRGARPYSRRGGRAMGSWIMYSPRSASAARKLAPILEVAARNIAERQVEDMTGVALSRRR